MSFTNIVDDDEAISRLGFILAKPIGNNDLLFYFETGFGFSMSDSASYLERGDFKYRRKSLRFFDLNFSGDSFGAFSAGQGSTVADGITDHFFDQTSVITSGSVPDIGGSFFPRGSDGVLSDLTISDAANSFDGDRRFRVRYDTLQFKGPTFSTPYDQEVLDTSDSSGFCDVGMVYDDTFGDFTIRGGIAYAIADPESGRDIETVSGSFGI